MTTRHFTSPDGTNWTVEVVLPGATSAMVIFGHPDGTTSRHDRYNWLNISGASSRNITSTADATALLEELTDPQIALLFRRSMPISAAVS